jgi:putative lipase involved disintegration of autophagic bodies
MDSKTIPFKQYTHPPQLRSNNYSEEQSYQKLIDYIYTKMDQLYNDSFKIDPLLNPNDIKFVLYMDRRTLLQLSRINGYRDLVSREDGGGFEFIGHKVVEVIGEEHINFVRIA